MASRSHPKRLNCDLQTRYFTGDRVTSPLTSLLAAALQADGFSCADRMARRISDECKDLETAIDNVVVVVRVHHQALVVVEGD